MLCTVLLLITGLIVLFAASYYNAQDKGSALSEVWSQLLGVAVGVCGMAVVLRLDYRLLKKPWVSGGLVGISVVFMARALSSGTRDVRKFFTRVVPLFAVPGLMFLLILMQPNLSTAGSILIVSVILVAMAGVRWRYLVMLGVGGACLGTFYALSEDYRRARLMSFTHPFDFLTNEGYQLSQSLMAFGSGGWFGMGLGKGRQKYAFLPYPESDFIFAVVGEDLGFVGCCGVLCLFCAFVFFGLRVAMRCRDRFGSLLAGGITAMIGVQCVMNVMVVTGMMPTTGLPLPFFSSGGTSIAIVLCAVAVLLNISRDVP